MSKQEKCKHAACNCMSPQGQSYCSDWCKDAKNMTEIACQCKHPGCRGSALGA